MTILRLYLEEDSMRRALVRSLQQRSVDVATASEAGMRERIDEEQLAYATAQGRAMTETTPLEERLSTLWDAVLNLALPASEQLAILEAIGDKRAVDELALDYDDIFWVVNEAESQNELTQDELSTLRSLDQQLDQMSGEANTKNWAVEALRFPDCWKEVRERAAIALATRQIAKVKKSVA